MQTDLHLHNLRRKKSIVSPSKRRTLFPLKLQESTEAYIEDKSRKQGREDRRIVDAPGGVGCTPWL